MNINKKRTLKSGAESNSDENNYYLNKYFKRKRIIQPMLSTEDNAFSDILASNYTKENKNINT